MLDLRWLVDLRSDAFAYSCAPLSRRALRHRDVVFRKTSAPRASWTGDSRNVPLEVSIDTAILRRWLSLLRQPSKLDSPELRDLLRARGRLPQEPTPEAVGRAGAALLRDAIQRLRPAGGASDEEGLPYQVLTLCFLEGLKLHQAAPRLDMSQRQLTRERSRAIALLRDRLTTDVEPIADFAAEEIPVVESFVARPEVTEAIERALADRRLAHVHGPAGIGKTSVVADIAARTRDTPVWWYRFRDRVNDSLPALMIDLGHWLSVHGIHDLSAHLRNPVDVDQTVTTRLALRNLGKVTPFVVLDDAHHSEKDPAIASFIEEAVARITRLRVAIITRRRVARDDGAVEVPGLTLEQAETFLSRLRIREPLDVVAKVHLSTGGNPQLVKLAARWISGSRAEDATLKLRELGDQAHVQDFLLETVTELLDADDRQVLEAAAIFRGHFSDDALAYVAELTRGAVQDASRRLVRAYIATRRARGDNAFIHSMVRNYVYDRLEVDRRQTLHLRAAAWYHRLGEEEETAYHRSSAGLDPL